MFLKDLILINESLQILTKEVIIKLLITNGILDISL